MGGKFIKEWDSATKASKTLGLSLANLCATANGRYRHCGGFRWTYDKDNLILKERKVRDINTYKRKSK